MRQNLAVEPIRNLTQTAGRARGNNGGGVVGTANRRVGRHVISTVAYDTKHKGRAKSGDQTNPDRQTLGKTDGFSE